MAPTAASPPTAASTTSVRAPWYRTWAPVRRCRSSRPCPSNLSRPPRPATRAGCHRCGGAPRATAVDARSSASSRHREDRADEGGFRSWPLPAIRLSASTRALRNEPTAKHNWPRQSPRAGAAKISSCVQLEHELADLGPQLADLNLVRGLLVFGPLLESALAGLHERVHPRLDLGLLEIVLAAHVHELSLPRIS